MRVIAGIGIEQQDYDVAQDPLGVNVPSSGFDLDFLEDNECVEYVGYILDYIRVENIQQFIKVLSSKMRKNGTIFLHGSNLSELSRLITMGRTNDIEVNQLLFSDPIPKTGLYTPNFIKSLIIDSQFTITKMNVELCTFSIEARKI